MIDIYIDKNYCKGCELCIKFCPKQVLELSEDINKSGYRYATLKNKENCIGCGICRTVCPDIAIKIEKEGV